MEAAQRTLSQNPKEKANIFSILFFLWTIEIFKRGYRKVLAVDDLFKPLSMDGSAFLGDRLERTWNNLLKKKKRPSLIIAVGITFWKDFFFMGVLAVINDIGIRIGSPILLGKLLTYFRVDNNETDEDKAKALTYGGLLILITFLGSICNNHYIMNSFHFGMRSRVAVCSIIYRKALRLSRSSLGDTAPGKVVNLLSNDVNRFDIFSLLVHYMWVGPTMTLIVAVLLYREVEWAGLIGIAVVFIVVPIQSYTGRLSSRFRYQTAVRTDERVRFMDEIISGVQVIKMYAWEKPFSKLINLARRLELKVVRKNSHVRALFMTFNLFTTRAAIFTTMATMMLMPSQPITAAKIFVVYAYYNAVAATMSQMFVRGVAEVAETLISFKRLQAFLEYDEKFVAQPQYLTENLNFQILGKGKNLRALKPKSLANVAVQLKNVIARWDTSHNATTITSSSSQSSMHRPVLDNITVNFEKGFLIGIIGLIGSGKSSLLQLILEELPLESGSIAVQGKISYASQEPWVFGASIRQNILFGEEMDKSRYDAVLKCCALTSDIEQFSNGDRTLIGEKGSLLSGGQKARVNLARAIYRKADIYLLDDPLSAVDAHVGRHLFDEVIGQYGRLARESATRILVTHQIHFLKQADLIIVLQDGKIHMKGSPAELSKSGIDFVELFDTETDNEIKKPGRSRSQSRSSRLSVISTDDEFDNESIYTVYEKEDVRDLEGTSKGTIKGSIALNYLKSGAHFSVLIILAILFLLTQLAVSVADYWVSFWTSQEELRSYYLKHNQSIAEIPIFKVYNNTLINKSESSPNILSRDLCLIIHGSIVCCIFIFGLIRSESFYATSARISQKLHDAMFNGIISAPLHFFDTNPSGRILNRFAKDMGAVDELLPKAILDASQIIISMFGAILLSSLVEPLFLVAVSILAFLFWLVRVIYLRTSKNVKRLEGITRSPVFTHLSASLGGLSTIRAFSAQAIVIKEFDSHQDLHTGAWYMFLSTSTAFGMSLDLICLVFLACVIFFFLLMDSDIMADKVGLAITQTMGLTGLLQWGIRQSAEVENQLMSVERILEYRDLEPEKQPKNPTPISKNWPVEGKIEFKNVFLRYSKSAEPVLKGINFVIHPQEKIGIVGRTGAGKSSLIGALFRLAEIEGEILINGCETASIVLNTLRSKISIIPQDPVLFSGTLRRNLDPFEEYPDENLWKALEDVELKDIACGPLGLQMQVNVSGSNFSVGQRQLVCLARAVLRNNKILVLDEATANVDPHTDSLIQKTIRRSFANCTVLTIAHRLITIMDSDRVLLMNAGIVEEFDIPYKLLQKPGAMFRDVVLATGQFKADKLYEIAKNKFESDHKYIKKN